MTISRTVLAILKASWKSCMTEVKGRWRTFLRVVLRNVEFNVLVRDFVNQNRLRTVGENRVNSQQIRELPYMHGKTICYVSVAY